MTMTRPAPHIQPATSNGPDQRAISHLLIVDDDPLISRLFEIGLKRQDRFIETVGDGQAAIERIRRGDIDLAILDLQLPGATGLEVLRRAQEEAPDTQIVMVTSTTELSTAVKALRNGAYDYVTKPVDLQKLRQLVGHALDARRLRIATNVARAVRSIGACVDLSELLPRVTAAAMAVTAATGVGLYLRRGAILGLAATDGFGDPSFMDEIASAAVAARTMLHRPAEAETASPLLCWPFVVQDKVMGAVVVQGDHTRQGFGHGEMERLSIVAYEAALAIDRAKLLTRLQTQVAELTRARARLLAAERIHGFGQLATSYALELLSPLEYLQSHLRDVRSELDGAGLSAAEKSVGYALEGASRMQASLADLALFGRDAPTTEIDVRRIVSAARRMAQVPDDVTVVEDVAEVHVVGQAANLAFALVRVVRNAVEASQKGGRTVRIRGRGVGNEVHLDVIDDGPGIPADMADRVFDPFFTTKADTAGLGLSVAREIVEASAGTVAIQSVEGGGTTVTFVFQRGRNGSMDEVAIVLGDS